MMSMTAFPPRPGTAVLPTIDHGFASREHRCQDAAFLVESARPSRTVRHDGHTVSHRSDWSSYCELAIDASDLTYYTVAAGDGQTTAAREADVDVGSESRPPRIAAHPFYTRLNQILDELDFDANVEI